MEILIILSVAYLALTLMIYPDGFIKNSVAWISFCIIYSISLLTENHYLLFLFIAVATTICVARYADIYIGDLIEILPLTIAAAFWLNIAEFIDGFVFSQLAVACGIIVISHLLFSQEKRLPLALLTVLFSYGILFAINDNYDINAFALSVCVTWIFCPMRTNSKNFTAIFPPSRPNVKSPLCFDFSRT